MNIKSCKDEHKDVKKRTKLNESNFTGQLFLQPTNF